MKKTIKLNSMKLKIKKIYKRDHKNLTITRIKINIRTKKYF